MLSGLLGSEPLLLLGLFQVLKGLPLFLVFNDFIFFLLLFDSDLLLNLNELLIGLFELSPGSGDLFLFFQIPHFLSLDLLLDLFFDQFPLQFFLFHPLDIVDIEIVKLLVDLLLVLESLLIGSENLFLHFPIVFFHLLFLKFFPLLVYLLKYLLFSLLALDLNLLLSLNVAQEHFRMECFNCVLVVMEHLIRPVKMSLPFCSPPRLLLSVDLSSRQLLK